MSIDILILIVIISLNIEGEDRFSLENLNLNGQTGSESELFLKYGSAALEYFSLDHIGVAGRCKPYVSTLLGDSLLFLSTYRDNFCFCFKPGAKDS